MQTLGIVLNVGADRTDGFEAGFREMEGPTWRAFHGRGVMQMATLSPIPDAVQYRVVVIFATDERYEPHDADPRFAAWNERADTYQVVDPYVFGGQTIVHVGP